jgi:hypothetical protein
MKILILMNNKPVKYGFRTLIAKLPACTHRRVFILSLAS